MKRYIIFLLLFGLVSCEGFLGKEPISSLTPGLFWKTQDDVEAAKATMYSAMATAMDANFFQWGEIRGNCWGSNESNGISQDQLRTHDIPNTHTTTKWTDLYAVVNRANLIIKYVPKMTVPDKDAIGQAYAMRALAYFWLTRVWGEKELRKEKRISGADRGKPSGFEAKRKGRAMSAGPARRKDSRKKRGK